MKMKTTFVLLLASAASLCAADMTVAGMYDSQLKMAESEIVSLAKAMPESAYNFAPTKGSFEKARTFGGQVKHVATVMFMVAAAAKEEAPPSNLGAGEDGPDDVKTKAQILEYLSTAFTYAHSVLNTLTTENQLDPVKSPFGAGTVARGMAANLTIWHTFDHYGQMAVYARMNNVIPPASQPAPPAAKK
jgi:DinB superfamily